jgi:hypothetical protein
MVSNMENSLTTGELLFRRNGKWVSAISALRTMNDALLLAVQDLERPDRGSRRRRRKGIRRRLGFR